MPFMFVNGQWAEVYRDGNHYLAVDSRISKLYLYPRSSDLYSEKPDWTPTSVTGVKIEIAIERTIEASEGYSRSHLCPEAIWGEIDGDLEYKVTSAKVVAIHGFEGNFICGHCEEYSATDPAPHAPCKCGHIGWVPWTDKVVPVIGPLQKPSRR